MFHQLPANKIKSRTSSFQNGCLKKKLPTSCLMFHQLPAIKIKSRTSSFQNGCLKKKLPTSCLMFHQLPANKTVIKWGLLWTLTKRFGAGSIPGWKGIFDQCIGSVSTHNYEEFGLLFICSDKKTAGEFDISATRHSHWLDDHLPLCTDKWT